MAVLDVNRAAVATEEYSARAQLRQTASIDEWYDSHVNRPLAAVFVRGAAHTGVTPNQITVVSGITGVASAFCIARAHGLWPMAGGLLLFLTMILDCADGQLARLRGGGTFIGRMMDGYADWITAVALHIGIWGYFAAHGFTFFGRELHGGLTTFLIALAAGASMAVHSMLYDYYKNRYLIMTGDGDPNTHSPDEIRQRIRDAESFGERFYLALYWVYCKSQTGLASEDRRDADSLDSGVVSKRRYYLGRGVRLWGGVGPTLHLVIIATSAVLAGTFTWGFHLYVIYVVVFGNLYTLAMLRRSRQLDAEMEAAIANG